MEVSQEAAHEERVAAGLPLDRLGERRGLLRLDPERLAEERDDRRLLEGSELERRQRGPRGPDASRRWPHDDAIDVAGAVGPDDQHRAQFRLRGDRDEQLQRRGVGPLQVLEEQHERRSRLDQRPHERDEEALKPVLGLHRTDLDDGRRLADELLQLGDALGEDAPIRRDCRSHALTQRRDPVCRRVQRLPDEPTDRVEKRSVGNVALEEIALALEPPAVRAGKLPDLVDERRLPDARGPGDEHDLGATGRDAVDGSLELRFRLLASVQIAAIRSP